MRRDKVEFLLISGGMLTKGRCHGRMLVYNIGGRSEACRKFSIGEDKCNHAPLGDVRPSYWPSRTHRSVRSKLLFRP